MKRILLAILLSLSSNGFSQLFLQPQSAKDYRERAKEKLNGSSVQDFAGAIVDFSRAIELSMADSIVYRDYVERGKAKFGLKDFRGAISDLTKYIDYIEGECTKKLNSPELTGMFEMADSFYLYRAMAKHNLKLFQVAIDDYNISIKYHPRNEYAFYNRGLAKFSLDNLNGACLDWSKAGELGHGKAYEMIQQHCQ